MLNATRYALAAICLTASVGCVAFWGTSVAYPTQVSRLSYYSSAGYVTGGTSHVGVHSGGAFVTIANSGALWVDRKGWRYQSRTMTSDTAGAESPSAELEVFRAEEGTYYFPLWYPALVFALAAVAAMRLGRRFTLRSALVGTSVVAALLGIVVAL